MLIHPKKVMACIKEKKANYLFPTLMTLYLVLKATLHFYSPALDKADLKGMALLLEVGRFSLVALGLFYLIGLGILGLSRLFSSKAKYKSILTALLWSTIPQYFLLPLYWLELSILSPYSPFYQATPTHADFLRAFVYFTSLLTIVASVWSKIISVFALKEVLEIKTWQVIVILVVTALVYGVCLYLLISCLTKLYILKTIT